jgi:hypothetical protein
MSNHNRGFRETMTDKEIYKELWEASQELDKMMLVFPKVVVGFQCSVMAFAL